MLDELTEIELLELELLEIELIKLELTEIGLLKLVLIKLALFELELLEIELIKLELTEIGLLDIASEELITRKDSAAEFSLLAVLNTKEFAPLVPLLLKEITIFGGSTLVSLQPDKIMTIAKITARRQILFFILTLPY